MSKSSAVPECRHILTSGRKCQAIALRGRPFCYNHSNQRTLAAAGDYKSVKLPLFEDHASVLLALNQVTRAMTAGRIDDKIAGRCLYAIQLAMQTIRRMEAEQPVEQVTDFLSGRFGDSIAVTDEPRRPEDLYYLLSEDEKSRASYGDHGWEPTNADYEPELQSRKVPAAQSVEVQSAASSSALPSAKPTPAPAQPRAADPAPKPAPSSPEEGALDLTGKSLAGNGSTGKISPIGTHENSPGRQLSDREPNSKSEVPQGMPIPVRRAS